LGPVGSDAPNSRITPITAAMTAETIAVLMRPSSWSTGRYCIELKQCRQHLGSP
jgi:hypothetical protein